MTIRVLIADDHPVVRSGLRALLSAEADIDVVAEAADGAESVTMHQTHNPDVALMDLRMPRMDGVTAIRAIRDAYPGGRIVVLTTYEGDADIHRALDAGACGYVLKDALGREVVDAIRTAAHGRRVIPPAVASRLAEFVPRVDLTARELDVLRLAAKGLQNKDIGRVLGCTEGTVKTHVRHIMEKLNATDRTEAVTNALQRGIIHLDD